MAETLSTVSVISFAVAGVLLALAIVLGLFFEIPKVIGDLTGITAKRAIAKMRAENEKTGVKKYNVSSVNLERGKITQTMSGIEGNNGNEDEGEVTESLVKNKMQTLTVIEEVVFIHTDEVIEC